MWDCIKEGLGYISCKCSQMLVKVHEFCIWLEKSFPGKYSASRSVTHQAHCTPNLFACLWYWATESSDKVLYCLSSYFAIGYKMFQSCTTLHFISGIRLCVAAQNNCWVCLCGAAAFVHSSVSPVRLTGKQTCVDLGKATLNWNVNQPFHNNCHFARSHPLSSPLISGRLAWRPTHITIMLLGPSFSHGQLGKTQMSNPACLSIQMWTSVLCAFLHFYQMLLKYIQKLDMFSILL